MNTTENPQRNDPAGPIQHGWCPMSRGNAEPVEVTARRRRFGPRRSPATTSSTPRSWAGVEWVRPPT